MKLLKQLLLLSLITLFVGCDDNEGDTVGPTIEITNIKDNAAYKFGETIVMKFKFKDQTGFYEYKYELYAEDFTSDSFTAEKYFFFDGFYTELEEAKSILLPEKSTNKQYKEGKYLIKVTAADIHQNLSIYYKPIEITYPVAE